MASADSTSAVPNQPEQPPGTEQAPAPLRSDLIALRVWLVCCVLMWLLGLFNLFAGAWNR
jgi:hypothetical protein